MNCNRPVRMMPRTGLHVDNGGFPARFGPELAKKPGRTCHISVIHAKLRKVFLYSVSQNNAANVQ
jgi:hypothetical protein